MNAAARPLERSVRLGAIALRVADSPWVGAAESHAVEGLEVTDERTGARAAWHAATGVYGLLAEQPGALTLRVRDPRSAFLELRAQVVMPETSSVATELQAGRSVAWNPKIVEIPALGGPARPIPDGQTVVWGSALDAEGAPRPFALLRLEAAGRRWLGGTDATGRYRLWLRGLPWRDSSSPRPTWDATLNVAAPAIPQAPLVEDALAMGSLAAPVARYPTTTMLSMVINFGTIQRRDLVL